MRPAGDEFGRTQQGNNNAYCQDNEISWVDWNIDDFNRQLNHFVCKLTGLRSAFPTCGATASSRPTTTKTSMSVTCAG